MNWAQQFNTFCFLDNHQYRGSPSTLECLLAAGCRGQVQGEDLSRLQHFIDEKKGSWLFGHLGYDLKNELELLSSHHPDSIQFPDLFLFEPEVIIHLHEKEMIINCDEPGRIAHAIENMRIEENGPSQEIAISHRISRDEYISVVKRLKEHILRGDCYELNFCQEFFSSPAVVDPLKVYKKLSAISPNPFSCLYRLQDRWLLCASPERFLKKEGSRILSQPIKGTSKRIVNDRDRDEQSRTGLLESKKDRSENVMVVDLVRNDLSRVCKEGTVGVDELFGIYSFPQVHQMISTVSGELRKDVSFTDIIRATFPMGSMTGAPKKRVMELIEMYEKTRRGIFSGAVGYISPNSDFDFNVVIRSIMYNATRQYLSFQTGSAITFYSNPESEWEECMLKAEAMKQCF